MRVYVKSVGTNITMVDIDSGDKFSVSAASVAKLFGVEFKEGEVWDINASKLGRHRRDLPQVADRYRRRREVEMEQALLQVIALAASVIALTLGLARMMIKSNEQHHAPV